MYYMLICDTAFTGCSRAIAHSLGMVELLSDKRDRLLELVYQYIMTIIFEMHISSEMHNSRT
jgi:hypothetical protein